MEQQLCPVVIHDLWKDFSHSSLYDLIILNTPIWDGWTEKTFLDLWINARCRICVDGAFNRLLDFIIGSNGDKETFLSCEMTVIGDLDSLKLMLPDEFLNYPINIIDLSHDQDHTDFEKALSHHKQCNKDDRKVIIYVIGGLRGRLDHTMAVLHSLLVFSYLDIWIIDEGSAGRLLLAGTKHSIRIHIPKGYESMAIGLVPIQGPVKGVQTTGLQWNLHNQTLKMGSFISSSNRPTGQDKGKDEYYNEIIVNLMNEENNALLWSQEFTLL